MAPEAAHIKTAIMKVNEHLNQEISERENKDSPHLKYTNPFNTTFKHLLDVRNINFQPNITESLWILLFKISNKKKSLWTLYILVSVKQVKPHWTFVSTHEAAL